MCCGGVQGLPGAVWVSLHGAGTEVIMVGRLSPCCPPLLAAMLWAAGRCAMGSGGDAPLGGVCAAAGPAHLYSTAVCFPWDYDFSMHPLQAVGAHHHLCCAAPRSRDQTVPPQRCLLLQAGGQLPPLPAAPGWLSGRRGWRRSWRAGTTSPASARV